MTNPISLTDRQLDAIVCAAACLDYTKRASLLERIEAYLTVNACGSEGPTDLMVQRAIETALQGLRQTLTDRLIV